MPMKPEEMYRVWAPEGALWSDWVAPALFAGLAGGDAETGAEAPDLAWFPAGLPERVAVILDLPGARAVRLAAQLAAVRGFRPVPVINASPGPNPLAAPGEICTLIPGSQTEARSRYDACVVDMRELVGALGAATGKIGGLRLDAAAPPVFILDAARMSSRRPAGPGMFDNRWMAFPQDFPSAGFLRKHGVEDVLLVQEDGGQPREDLAHVLLRWQEGGVRIRGRDGAPLAVRRPGQFRALWYRAMATLGLWRNSAGGFGACIPERTSAG